MDPIAGSGSYKGILPPMLDSLVGKKGGALAPGVVDSWQISADGLSWTFRIRKGIKFHTGDDLTARDVKFSLERWVSAESFYPYLRTMLKGVELVDDYTVRLTTAGLQPYLAHQMSTVSEPNQGLIMPMDYVTKNGLAAFIAKPVGSGPWKFVKYTPGDSIHYVANEGSWQQVPAFKTLSITQIPEESTRVAALKTGEIDVADISIDASKGLEALGISVQNIASNIVMLQIHGAYEAKAAGMPTADLRVRQALSLAINRDEIAKSMFGGKVGPLTAPYLSDQPVDDIDGQYWVDYASKAYRYDVQAAKKLLADAGYPRGFSTKIYSYTQTGAPYQPQLVEVLVGYFAAIGVTAQIVPIDWGAFQIIRNPLKTPDTIGNISTYRYPFNPNSAKNMTTGYASSGSFSLFSKAMPNMDQLVKDSQSQVDVAKRKDLLAQVIKTATDAFVAISIVNAPTFEAVSARVAVAFDAPVFSVPLNAAIMKHK